MHNTKSGRSQELDANEGEDAQHAMLAPNGGYTWNPPSRNLSPPHDTYRHSVLQNLIGSDLTPELLKLLNSCNDAASMAVPRLLQQARSPGAPLLHTAGSPEAALSPSSISRTPYLLGQQPTPAMALPPPALELGRQSSPKLRDDMGVFGGNIVSSDAGGNEATLPETAARAARGASMDGDGSGGGGNAAEQRFQRHPQSGSGGPERAGLETRLSLTRNLPRSNTLSLGTGGGGRVSYRTPPTARRLPFADLTEMFAEAAAAPRAAAATPPIAATAAAAAAATAAAAAAAVASPRQQPAATDLRGFMGSRLLLADSTPDVKLDGGRGSSLNRLSSSAVGAADTAAAASARSGAGGPASGPVTVMAASNMLDALERGPGSLLHSHPQRAAPKSPGGDSEHRHLAPPTLARPSVPPRPPPLSLEGVSSSHADLTRPSLQSSTTSPHAFKPYNSLLRVDMLPTSLLASSAPDVRQLPPVQSLSAVRQSPPPPALQPLQPPPQPPLQPPPLQPPQPVPACRRTAGDAPQEREWLLQHLRLQLLQSASESQVQQQLLALAGQLRMGRQGSPPAAAAAAAGGGGAQVDLGGRQPDDFSMRVSPRVGDDMTVEGQEAAATEEYHETNLGGRLELRRGGAQADFSPQRLSPDRLSPQHPSPHRPSLSPLDLSLRLLSPPGLSPHRPSPRAEAACNTRAMEEVQAPSMAAATAAAAARQEAGRQVGSYCRYSDGDGGGGGDGEVAPIGGAPCSFPRRQPVATASPTALQPHLLAPLPQPQPQPQLRSQRSQNQLASQPQPLQQLPQPLPQPPQQPPPLPPPVPVTVAMPASKRPPSDPAAASQQPQAGGPPQCKRLRCLGAAAGATAGGSGVPAPEAVALRLLPAASTDTTDAAAPSQETATSRSSLPPPSATAAGAAARTSAATSEDSGGGATTTTATRAAAEAETAAETPLMWGRHRVVLGGFELQLRSDMECKELGLFHPERYLAGGDCIERPPGSGVFLSRSQFERAGGAVTAKWHRSIRVLPQLERLGSWLERHGLPVLKGSSRRRGRGAPGGILLPRGTAPSPDGTADANASANRLNTAAAAATPAEAAAAVRTGAATADAGDDAPPATATAAAAATRARGRNAAGVTRSPTVAATDARAAYGARMGSVALAEAPPLHTASVAPRAAAVAAEPATATVATAVATVGSSFHATGFPAVAATAAAGDGIKGVAAATAVRTAGPFGRASLEGRGPMAASTQPWLPNEEWAGQMPLRFHAGMTSAAHQPRSEPLTAPPPPLRHRRGPSPLARPMLLPLPPLPTAAAAAGATAALSNDGTSGSDWDPDAAVHAVPHAVRHLAAPSQLLYGWRRSPSPLRSAPPVRHQRLAVQQRPAAAEAEAEAGQDVPVWLPGGGDASSTVRSTAPDDREEEAQSAAAAAAAEGTRPRMMDGWAPTAAAAVAGGGGAGSWGGYEMPTSPLSLHLQPRPPSHSWSGGERTAGWPPPQQQSQQQHYMPSPPPSYATTREMLRSSSSPLAAAAAAAVRPPPSRWPLGAWMAAPAPPQQHYQLPYGPPTALPMVGPHWPTCPDPGKPPLPLPYSPPAGNRSGGAMFTSAAPPPAAAAAARTAAAAAAPTPAGMHFAGYSARGGSGGGGDAPGDEEGMRAHANPYHAPPPGPWLPYPAPPPHPYAVRYYSPRPATRPHAWRPSYPYGAVLPYEQQHHPYNPAAQPMRTPAGHSPYRRHAATEAPSEGEGTPPPPLVLPYPAGMPYDGRLYGRHYPGLVSAAVSRPSFHPAAPPAQYVVRYPHQQHPQQRFQQPASAAQSLLPPQQQQQQQWQQQEREASPRSLLMDARLRASPLRQQQQRQEERQEGGGQGAEWLQGRLPEPRFERGPGFEQQQQQQQLLLQPERQVASRKRKAGAQENEN